MPLWEVQCPKEETHRAQYGASLKVTDLMKPFTRSRRGQVLQGFFARMPKDLSHRR